MAYNPYYQSYGAYQNGGFYAPQAVASPQLPQAMPQAQQVQPASGLNWIEGAEAARAYIVAPNCTVVLFDTKNPIMYIKSADISGLPTTRTFKISEIDDNFPTTEESISRKEIESFENRIAALEKQVKSFSASKKVKEDKQDEPTV